MQKAGNSTVSLASGNVYCEESTNCTPTLADVGSVYCQNTINCEPELSEGNFVCATKKFSNEGV
eukprot:TRINITY_DN6612_c0_g1_i1.p4 TRINITY_DN6612_c0_g1~~TRINITY_DN6612_c0_g1_i1.p4  ORF type:complete len:64 (+),score=17.08 TRINITY_DN6612_c0_g1_i1:232-423(+)